jgi:hypothetical protein
MRFSFRTRLFTYDLLISVLGARQTAPEKSLCVFSPSTSISHSWSKRVEGYTKRPMLVAPKALDPMQG